VRLARCEHAADELPLQERSAELDKKGGPNSVSGKDAAPPPKDEKQAGKDIPKDDKAKEEAKKQEEMKVSCLNALSWRSDEPEDRERGAADSDALS
jgi:hypothetical protein